MQLKSCSNFYTMFLLNVQQNTTQVQTLPDNEDQIGFEDLQNGIVFILFAGYGVDERTGRECYTLIRSQYATDLGEIDIQLLLDEVPADTENILLIFQADAVNKDRIGNYIHHYIADGIYGLNHHRDIVIEISGQTQELTLSRWVNNGRNIQRKGKGIDGKQ